ncbi:MAG TPA: hypothetical protein VGY31_17760 [Terriglobia bacterium]|nr:hypothetical protein [Terriglobia bacterium]
MEVLVLTIWVPFSVGAALIGAVIFFTLCRWHPPVGVYIAALAVLGVFVPLIRWEKAGPEEKALWTAVMLVLVGLEISSIYKDRNEHDAEQARARKEQLEGFQRIADGLSRSIAQSQENFNATMARSSKIMERVQTSIDSITGGNSFVYMQLVGLQKTGAILHVQHAGKFPLHNVSARITDLNIFKQLVASRRTLTMSLPSDTIVPIGDISANAGRTLTPLTFTGSERQDYNIFFYGQNGFWKQLIRLRWVASGWLQATIVLGGPNGTDVLYEYIDPQFPLINGNVDWNSN